MGVDAVNRSDGRLAVANAGTDEFRCDAPDGRFLARAGGEGEGPGELRDVAAVFLLPADLIMVYDYSLLRVSVLGSDASVGDTLLSGSRRDELDVEHLRLHRLTRG